MNREPEGYSKFLVIFVDILGSKNRKKFSETYHINKIFHEEFEKQQQNNKDHTVYFRKIYTFSDCAYIFYGFKDGISDEQKNKGKLFTVALCNCEPIFLRFIKDKIIFRGGISYGDAYVDPGKSMFFGNAVNRAYLLESEEAIHPRIVVEDSVAEEVLGNISLVKKAIEQNPKCGLLSKSALNQIMTSTGDGVVEKDIDGKYIYNYLHFPEKNIKYENYYSSSEEYLTEIIDYCTEQIEKNKQYRIIDKYYYLLRFAEAKRENCKKQKSDEEMRDCVVLRLNNT